MVCDRCERGVHVQGDVADCDGRSFSTLVVVHATIVRTIPTHSAATATTQLLAKPEVPFVCRPCERQEARQQRCARRSHSLDGSILATVRGWLLQLVRLPHVLIVSLAAHFT
jgi:hypothetical protein